MASDRFVEQTRLARASSAVAQEMRQEAVDARARCRDIVRQDRLLRHRISDGRTYLAPLEPVNNSAKVAAVRTVGLVDSARGVVPHGHLCWAYQDRAEFLARALEWISDGIALGQWIEYVGDSSAEMLREELAGLDGMKELLDGAGIGVSSVGDFYRFTAHSDVVDPVAAVATVVAATEKALAAGYTGFRASVDATAMVRTREQRAGFARYEHLLDREMTVASISALCAYDVSELGAAAVAELACLHPLTRTGSTPFQLHADQDIDFALAGDIDLSCGELFATTLERVVPLTCGPERVVDGRAMEFIDHRRLLMLIETAQRAGATVVLHNAPRTAVRMIEVLELDGVHVEARK
ncbi:MAG: MEDS domain-containing protein [Pseudonocardiaceae bacterium]